jgi:hypothetical protein
VAAVSLLVYGCATTPVPIEVEPPRGHISTRPGRPGVVVAAPHGTSDTRTGEIASDIARRTGFGLVVATGFSLEPDTADRAGRRYQVNRPLEGVPGRGPSEETRTPEAQRVYEAWQSRVRETAHGPLRLYVEIHGNNRRDTADRIEIATVGIDDEHARQLRTLLELTRDAHLRGHPDAPRLAILVEPADRVFYGAGGAKREGIFTLPERGMHIELPKSARIPFRELYTAILAGFLQDAVALRPFATR